MYMLSKSRQGTFVSTSELRKLIPVTLLHSEEFAFQGRSITVGDVLMILF